MSGAMPQIDAAEAEKSQFNFYNKARGRATK
jgi:hypothetical protein